jgi:DNA-binding NarL/FixJ family response regulator
MVSTVVYAALSESLDRTSATVEGPWFHRTSIISASRSVSTICKINLSTKRLVVSLRGLTYVNYALSSALEARSARTRRTPKSVRKASPRRVGASGQLASSHSGGRSRLVIRLVVRGYRNLELADAFGVSEETSKTHVSGILSKLGVCDRTCAMLKAVERELI